MADWIKMRAGLLTNPKVIRMSRQLLQDQRFTAWMTNGTSFSRDVTRDVTRDVSIVTRVTVGCLLSLWGAVNDSASSDGFVRGITLFEVDEMAGLPGFGDALVTVGWAEVCQDGILFPNFEEHNTTEKARSDKGSGPKTGAQRTKEWRNRRLSQNVTGDVTQNVTGDVTQNVTGDVTVTTREEKNREEKKDIYGDVTSVLEYLNKKAGRNFQSVAANTKLIVARLREGATVEQMKAVVDVKVRDWLHDPKMSEYLRPATLFNAEKFGQYVGALGTKANGHQHDEIFG